MENGNNYQERRAGNRKAYLGEKRKNDEKYRINVKMIVDKINSVERAADFFIANEEKLKEKFNKLKEDLAMLERFDESNSLEGLDKSIKEIRTEYDRKMSELVKSPSFYQDPSKTLSHVRKQVAKDFYKKIRDSQREIGCYFANLRCSLSELIKNIHRPSFSFVDSSIINPLKETISKIENCENEDLLGLFDKLKTGLMPRFIEQSKLYREAIAAYKPELKDKMKEIAKANLGLLEEECSFRKKAYFNSLEGLVLEFCTYYFESRKADEDSEYFDFLTNKSEEKLANLKEKDISDVIRGLDSLRKRQYIRDDEHNFMRATLINEFNIGEKTREDNLEDIQLRAVIIGDYNVTPIEAIRIAKLTTDNNVDNVSRKLPMEVGSELGNILIKNNPRLFLMDEKQTIRYIERLKETLELAGRYDSVDDFNPLKSPHNFSGLDALKETRRKLYDIVRESALISNGQGENTAGMLSEVERIRMGLAREGYDPDMALAIIRRGFYFHGEYFTGDHRISIESLEENTKRDKNVEFDSKRCYKELKKLMAVEGVLFNRGYSLNPHLKEIGSEAVRRAINYVLQSNPREDE